MSLIKCRYNFQYLKLSFARFRQINLRASGSEEDTGVVLYNPLVKKKVPLRSKKNYFTWYSCGPTVYDVSHIGHASSYVRLDVIRRVLTHWFGVKPIIALGMTDIDDKIIARSKDLGVDFSEVSKKYELAFFRDMKRLHVLEPHFVLRVTEHISEIVNFVSSIINKGQGYTLEDGSVYFNTQSLPSYGKVTGAQIPEASEPKEGQRLHPADFALWKASKPGEPSWPSPWSAGRPGWHIECSAMASKIFGSKLDLHSGGLDLAFPHHENEEAQSCAYHSVDQWVNHWAHTGHLLMNGMKMSKSMKNFIPIETFLEEHNADQFRMLCLLTHYRTSIDYTPDVMTKAIAMVEKFTSFFSQAKSYCCGSWDRGNVSGVILLEMLEDTKTSIQKSLADDMNTAQAINQIEDLVTAVNAMLQAETVEGASRDVAALAVVVDFVQEFLQSLGLLQSEDKKSETATTSYIIEKSSKFRNKVRHIARSSNEKSTKTRLFQACDELRTDLKAANITIQDTSKISCN